MAGTLLDPITMIILRLDSLRRRLLRGPNPTRVYQDARLLTGPVIVCMVEAHRVGDHQKTDDDRAKTIPCPGEVKTITGDPMTHLQLGCPKTASHQVHHDGSNPRTQHDAPRTASAAITPADQVLQRARAATVTVLPLSPQRRALPR